MSNKQQTLKEFINSQPYYGTCTPEYLEGIEEGAKWQKERMYSEEDVVLILEFARKNFYDTGTKWHQEPYIDLTSQELIKKYHEQK